MGQALPVQHGQFRHQGLEFFPLNDHHRPACDRILQGVARVPQGQHRHRAPLPGEGQLLKLSPRPGVGKLPPQQQGEHSIAQSRRNEDAPHPQRGPQQPPCPRVTPPDHGHQQQRPPEGTGEHQEQRPCPQQPLRPTKGRQEHKHRRAGLADRVLQKAPVRQQGQSSIGRSQGGGQRGPPPAHRLPIQLAGTGQQQIVHHKIQHQEGIQIDHRHSIPSSHSPSSLSPIIRPAPLKKGQKGERMDQFVPAFSGKKRKASPRETFLRHTP